MGGKFDKAEKQLVTPSLVWTASKVLSFMWS